MSVLESYLTWKLSITTDDFQKYCRNYLPLKHKPMSDVQEAIDIALNMINFNIEDIRRNGFILSSDPIKTKLIIENVPSLAGLDIREAIRIEPAILKNNYNSLLKIRDLLEVCIYENMTNFNAYVILGVKFYCSLTKNFYTYKFYIIVFFTSINPLNESHNDIIKFSIR